MYDSSWILRPFFRRVIYYFIPKDLANPLLFLGLLPALHHDDTWVSGYSSIVKHLISNSICMDLDASLDASSRADLVAYSSYISLQVSSLLDLSLYVSAANWSMTTRPAYSQLLPFPLTWTIPPLIRAEAIKRVEHLGLDELDSDFDPHGGLHITAGSNALPESLRKHLPLRTKKTIQEEMTPEQAAAIRLYSIIEDYLSPLETLLHQSRKDISSSSSFLLHASSISSLDCLAFGYLSLMFHAPVPRSFLKDWLEENAPLLRNLIQNIQLANSPLSEQELPWAPAQATTLAASTGRVLDSVMRHVPTLGEYYTSEMRHRMETKTSGFDQRAAIFAIGLLTTSLAAGYGVYYYRQLSPFGAMRQTWQPKRAGSRLSEFGQLGSILDSALGPMPSFAAGGNLQGSNGRLVDVDTELD